MEKKNNKDTGNEQNWKSKIKNKNKRIKTKCCMIIKIGRGEGGNEAGISNVKRMRRRRQREITRRLEMKKKMIKKYEGGREGRRRKIKGTSNGRPGITRCLETYRE